MVTQMIILYIWCKDKQVVSVTADWHMWFHTILSGVVVSWWSFVLGALEDALDKFKYIYYFECECECEFETSDTQWDWD